MKRGSRPAVGTRPYLMTVFASVALGSLVGCAQHKPMAPDPVAIALAQSTSEVAKAWRSVGAVSEAQNPGAIDYLGDYQGNVPVALQERVSLRWAGPVSGVIEELSKRIGWTYRSIGNKPANELPVFVDAHSREIAQIIRDVGYQAGGRADVIVKPAELVMEVVYAQ